MNQVMVAPDMYLRKLRRLRSKHDADGAEPASASFVQLICFCLFARAEGRAWLSPRPRRVAGGRRADTGILSVGGPPPKSSPPRSPPIRICIPPSPPRSLRHAPSPAVMRAELACSYREPRVRRRWGNAYPYGRRTAARGAVPGRPRGRGRRPQLDMRAHAAVGRGSGGRVADGVTGRWLESSARGAGRPNFRLVRMQPQDASCEIPDSHTRRAGYTESAASQLGAARNQRDERARHRAPVDAGGVLCRQRCDVQRPLPGPLRPTRRRVTQSPPPPIEA